MLQMFLLFIMLKFHILTVVIAEVINSFSGYVISFNETWMYSSIERNFKRYLTRKQKISSIDEVKRPR